MTPEENSPKPGKRLAVFFDGTWNKPENNTNVWRLSLMLADGRGRRAQRKFYDEGVGTRLLDRFTGGAFGYGLSGNVRAGYRWLMEHYNPGDEIFIFGFSRGAVHRAQSGGSDRTLWIVKTRRTHVLHAALRALPERRHRPPRFTGSDTFRDTAKHNSTLKRTFCSNTLTTDAISSKWWASGTPSALSEFPFGNIPGISSRTLQFHNTNLSKIVQHSYQALAPR